ncbi:MAG TPA: 50S ribosomal protein L5 [Candidatus Eisenbacteria bacterium]|nr:50S ribosomal protein L5 [Candidatus Eisenbacteria bacterium]
MQKTKPRLMERYEKVAAPQAMEKFGLKNTMAVPKFKKVVINVGLKQGIKDPKFIDHAEKILSKISGQKPVKTLAKKSISNFKIRQGMVVGMMVTLRGRRMYDFLDKLVNVTLPRVRDFRGLSPKTIDHHGNMTIGFKEFIAFPEVRPDDTDYVHGLEITIVTNAKSKDQGLTLLRGIGFPINEK